MAQKFKVGDHVTWNSEAGHVSGRIIKVHTNDFDHKGYTHHASKDVPRYEIKSDKTDHIAMHKVEFLRGMQLSHLDKSEKAKEELANKGPGRLLALARPMARPRELTSCTQLSTQAYCKQ